MSRRKDRLLRVLRLVAAEVVRHEMLIVADMDLGHTSPMDVRPLGCRVRIDPKRRRVSVIEPGVT
jgi:muramoyltetrapeptide carboxypeptidase LdcA involved in peptidoglycan recycling